MLCQSQSWASHRSWQSGRSSPWDRTFKEGEQRTERYYRKFERRSSKNGRPVKHSCWTNKGRIISELWGRAKRCTMLWHYASGKTSVGAIIEVTESLLAKITGEPINWQLSFREVFLFHISFVFLWKFLVNKVIFLSNSILKRIKVNETKI